MTHKTSRVTKAALTFAALLAFVCSGAAPLPAVAAPPTEAELKAVVDKSMEAMTDFSDAGFSMKYPTSWERETKDLPPSQLMRAKTMQGAANVIVVSDKVNPGDTIETYATGTAAALKEAFGDKLALINNDPVEINGNKGRLLVMVQEIKEEGREPLKFKQYMVLFVANGKAYGVSCTTLDSWFPQFEKVFKAMADSVNITAVASKSAESK